MTFVFSTATQPAFEHPPGKEDPRWAPGTLTEIIQAPAPLRQALKRAEIHWEVHSFWAWAQVCDRASRADQSLTIVNLRRHAAELFGEMRRRVADSSVVFHLSTRMCAAHRLRTLDAIRRRLRGGEPCHVVSTQLVEAGVDIDFPLVLRALAPLDAIVQAAGRADREGRLTAAQGRPGGIVVVFQPEDGGMPPHEYRQAAELTKAVVEGLRVAPDSVEAMRCFFERYYGEGADLGMQLAKMRKRLSFATLADEFEMISSRTRDVFVPDDDDARDAIAELQEIGVVTAGLRRRLQRHIVGLNPSEFDTARRMLFPLSPTEDVWIASEAAYTEDLGLHLEPEGAGVFV